MSAPGELNRFLSNLSADERFGIIEQLAEGRPDLFKNDVLPVILEGTTTDLEPLAIRDGIDYYLEKKADEVGASTLDQYRTKMQYVEEYFTNVVGIENLNDLTPRDASGYKEWRRMNSLDRDEPMAPKTLKDDMHLYTGFLEYMAALRAVLPDVSKGVTVPMLDDGDGVDKTILEPERAKRTLEYLAQFQYASLEQINLLLLAKTGRRPCDIHALDLGDFDDTGDETTLQFVHRPETGTRLKKGTAHEAMITLGEHTGPAIRAYIEHNRATVTDEYGREPLVTTAKGRISKSTIKEHAYKWTRPCHLGQGCPHDRNIEECPAAQSAKHASKCPGSRSPRPIRSGYITAKLNAGADYEAVGYRVGATKRVLKKHYDNPHRDDERQRYRDAIMTSNLDDSGYTNTE